MSTDTKPTNPKDIAGSDKLPLSLVPATAIAATAVALLDGMLKYGKVNWREVGIRYSIYLDAIQRHLDRVKEGEDNDPVTDVPHLAYILANCSIILDALDAGKVVDDRAMATGVFDAAAAKWTGLVVKVKALHADRVPPKHYLTADKQDAPAPAPEPVVSPASVLMVKVCKGCASPRVCAQVLQCEKTLAPLIYWPDNQ